MSGRRKYLIRGACFIGFLCPVPRQGVLVSSCADTLRGMGIHKRPVAISNRGVHPTILPEPEEFGILLSSKLRSQLCRRTPAGCSARSRLAITYSISYQKRLRKASQTSSTSSTGLNNPLLLLTHNLFPSQRSPPPKTGFRLLQTLAFLLLFPVDPDNSSRDADRDCENGIQSSAQVLESGSGSFREYSKRRTWR
jgi:hypothetical protein